MVLLFDPSQSPPFDVRGEVLGKSAWAELSPASARQPVTGCPTPACQFFPETGHTLQSPLRAYWEQNGGLPIFGYPMSEAFTEKSPTDGKTYLVQYFERNRLEYHPEYTGTPNEVLLGLLGTQEYDRRYTP